MLTALALYFESWSGHVLVSFLRQGSVPLNSGPPVPAQDSMSAGGKEVEGLLDGISGGAAVDWSPALRGLHRGGSFLYPKPQAFSGSSFALTAEEMTRKASSSKNQ